MQQRHSDRNRYFEEQARTTEKYYIPYLKSHIGVLPESVLEVGCGEGGNLLPFAKAGCRVTDVDYAQIRIEEARQYFAQNYLMGEFIAADVLTMHRSGRHFPLIIAHDVIEHISDKETFLETLSDLLETDGHIFIGFPSWRMPFGGHQQIAQGRIVSHLPFIHLLPMGAYRGFLRMTGETAEKVNELADIRRTRCTINGFERRVKYRNFQIVDRRLYFINPHYETKFGLKPRKLWNWLSRIPYIRDYFVTTCFYILEHNHAK